MIEITASTENIIKELAKQFGLILKIDKNAKFQGESTRANKTITLAGKIDPLDFDRLFQQNGLAQDIPHDQSMFIYNFFHELGHFQLNLWTKNDGSIVSRVQNLTQDVEVDKHALKQFGKWKNRK